MSVNTSKYRSLFFSEAHEQLEFIEDGLRKLERVANDRAAMDAAFRAAHTLKGMAATMGYDDVTAAAHGLEDLLQSLRNMVGGASASMLDLLFSALNDLTLLISQVETDQMQSPDGSERRQADSGTLILSSPLLEREDTQQRGGFAPVIRVSVATLNQLNDLVAQLIASGTQLTYTASAERERLLREHLQTVRELGSAAWNVRMVPIGEVFQRYLRMLQDVAQEQGKYVRVTIEGSEIEVGRAVLEEISEPLLHLLRNAIAHGIETPAERLRRGKDPRGTITLRAFSSGELMTVQVTDDGGGLDPNQILQAALDQKFITKEQRAGMTASEALNLIMLPGFSMSREITQLSGRGVGMDVVKAKIEALRGTITIRSEHGSGTTFSMYVPRTLGLLEVELVRVASHVYAIPVSQIERSVWMDYPDIMRFEAGNLAGFGSARPVLDLNSFVDAPLVTQDEYGVLLINTSTPLALRVDELLGKALLGDSAHSPAVPLLNLAQLLSPYAETTI